MKHKIIKVEIGFSESPDIRNNPVFSSMLEANRFFSSHNRQAEQDRDSGKLLGYYKTDFTLVFDDGTQYKGRYDIGSDAPDLTTHIRSFALAYSGRSHPSRMSAIAWADYLNRQVSPESRKYFAGILDNYELD